MQNNPKFNPQQKYLKPIEEREKAHFQSFLKPLEHIILISKQKERLNRNLKITGKAANRPLKKDKNFQLEIAEKLSEFETESSMDVLYSNQPFTEIKNSNWDY